MSAHNSLLEEITTANRRFMGLFRQSDIAGVAQCYTEDAIFLLPHMNEIKGRAAIEAVFKVSAGIGHALQFDTLELEGNGNSALEIGQYTRTGSAGEILDKGKYLVVWKRVGADWKIHRGMINTSLPKQA